MGGERRVAREAGVRDGAYGRRHHVVACVARLVARDAGKSINSKAGEKKNQARKDTTCLLVQQTVHMNPKVFVGTSEIIFTAERHGQILIAPLILKPRPHATKKK